MVIDFRFLEINTELNSLKDLLETIKQQEKKLSEIRLEEVNKYLISISPNDVESEWDVLRDEYLYRTEHLYPKSFRGSFLVGLWATTESALQELANFVQKKKDIKLKLNDIRGDIIERLEKYFNQVLHFELFSEQAMERLREIYLIRNCFAHANGRIDALKENDKRIIQKRNEDNSIYQEDQGYILLEMGYLEDINNFISVELQQLINRIKEFDDALNKVT
jgi:hypothetical protein